MEQYLASMCGLNGSGKTRLRKWLKSDMGIYTISVDEIGIAKYGRPCDYGYTSKNPEHVAYVKTELRKKRDKALIGGKDVLIDSGATTNEKRMIYLGDIPQSVSNLERFDSFTSFS